MFGMAVLENECCFGIYINFVNLLKPFQTILSSFDSVVSLLHYKCRDVDLLSSDFDLVTYCLEDEQGWCSFMLHCLVFSHMPIVIPPPSCFPIQAVNWQRC